MLENFISDIKFLYQSIINYEKPSLVEFKNKWDIKNSIGEKYEKLSKRGDKKEKGSFYTPYEVVDYMVTELVKKIDLKTNPNLKILDPSCGGGYFLMSLIEKLTQSSPERTTVDTRDSSPYSSNPPSQQSGDSSSNFKILPSHQAEEGSLVENQHVIQVPLPKMKAEKNRDSSPKNADTIYKSLLENNIYGYDTDENAIMITVIELYEKTGQVAKNILVKDFLLEDSKEFDFIIGNPPYMGHKVLKGEYRDLLKDKYSEVFRDKGDLAYCFIKKSIDSLKAGGNLNFFTSRYILEALNGSDIRKYILDNGNMIKLVDFYGVRVVKGAGVDTIIIDFIKGGTGNYTNFYRLKNSAKGMGRKVFDELSEYEGCFTRGLDEVDEGQFTYLDKTSKTNNTVVHEEVKFPPSSFDTEFIKYIRIRKSELNKEGWTFLTTIEQGIVNKIQGTALKDICISYQGIITGCDDAFVVEKSKAMDIGIEKELLKPWIKGKNIEKFRVTRGNEFLIYSNAIEHEHLYPVAMGYICHKRERLETRRECIKGIRRWFDLQWGRDEKIFQESKIIFPYKSSKNRFAIDKGSFFSADVYALKLKEDYVEIYSHEFLTGVLNSRIYEFYIKTMAKKLGEDLYEYYPNKIMNIRIPDFIEEIDEAVRKNVVNLGECIDKILVEYFGIDDEEYNVIKSWCN